MSEVHTERPNRATPSEAGSFVDKYVELDVQEEDELAVIDAEMKKKKRAVSKKYGEEKTSLLEDGKKQGVQKTTIRALAGQSKLARKAQRLAEKAQEKIDGLPEEEQEYAIDIREALGSDFASFGLGAVAVVKDDAGPPDETTAAILDAVAADSDDE